MWIELLTLPTLTTTHSHTPTLHTLIGSRALQSMLQLLHPGSRVSSEGVCGDLPAGHLPQHQFTSMYSLPWGLSGSVCRATLLCQQNLRVSGVWPCGAGPRGETGWFGEMILNTALLQVYKIGSLPCPPFLPSSLLFPSLHPSLLFSLLPPFILPFRYLCPQVTCLSSGCLSGTYSSTSTAAIGDLQSDSDVCIPCDPLCEVCTGPGTRLGMCILCRYATRLSEGCVRSCNTTTGEEFIY